MEHSDWPKARTLSLLVRSNYRSICWFDSKRRVTPRLVLLEVDLILEYIKWAQRYNELSPEERLARLPRTVDLLQNFLAELNNISDEAALKNDVTVCS